MKIGKKVRIYTYDTTYEKRRNNLNTRRNAKGQAISNEERDEIVLKAKLMSLSVANHGEDVANNGDHDS